MTRPGLDRTLFWTMVVACFTAALACLGARSLDRAAADVLRDRTGYIIVRVIAPDGPDGLHRAAAALIGSSDVAEAEVMSTQRAADLLELWSGAAVNSADLPPLRLIEVTMQPDIPAGAQTERAIVALLGEAGVLAEAIGPPDDGGRAAEAGRLRQAALWAALGLSAVMALIVALAARALAARRRDLVTVLADLGATSGEASLRVTDEAGGNGFLAGVLGALAAGAAAAAFASMVYPDLDGRSLLAFLRPADVAPLLAAPVIAALAAGLGARLAAQSMFARAERVG